MDGAKIKNLKAKKMGHMGGKDPKSTILGNTFKKAGMTPHRILESTPKLKAKTK